MTVVSGIHHFIAIIAQTVCFTLYPLREASTFFKQNTSLFRTPPFATLMTRHDSGKFIQIIVFVRYGISVTVQYFYLLGLHRITVTVWIGVISISSGCHQTVFSVTYLHILRVCFLVQDVKEVIIQKEGRLQLAVTTGRFIIIARSIHFFTW